MSRETSRPDATKNLVGQPCPMNVVYAKVELARLGKGQMLELVLEDGPAVDNVTRSLEKEGHILCSRKRRRDGNWSLFFRKGGQRE